jgi:hypothetical protein
MVQPVALVAVAAGFGGRFQRAGLLGRSYAKAYAIVVRHGRKPPIHRVAAYGLRPSGKPREARQAASNAGGEVGRSPPAPRR